MEAPQVTDRALKTLREIGMLYALAQASAKDGSAPPARRMSNRSTCITPE